MSDRGKVLSIQCIVLIAIAIVATIALLSIPNNYMKNTPPSEFLTTKANKKGVATHCPIMDIRTCSRWKEAQEMSTANEPNNWIFNNTDCETEEAKHQEDIYIVPKRPSIARGLDKISKNKTSIVFYGSSHIRELHLAFVRLKRGLHYMDDLEANLTNVPSGLGKAVNSLWQLCDPFQSSWRDGKYGVDLDSCGLPGKRLVPELG